MSGPFEVITPQLPNIGDIAGALRRLADQIEGGELGTVVSVAWIAGGEAGLPTVGVVGQCHNRLHAIGLIEAGKQAMLEVLR